MEEFTPHPASMPLVVMKGKGGRCGGESGLLGEEAEGRYDGDNEEQEEYRATSRRGARSGRVRIMMRRRKTRRRKVSRINYL